MRIETGSFELHDDMMVRELTLAETNEVAGGVGTAEVVSAAQSGAGSTLSVSGSFALATSNTTASAAIAETVRATGANNLLAVQAIAIVS
jgi:hypothetical protein